MAMMTATKMLSYLNRRMVPGEDFEAKSARDIKVLLATRKAKIKREPTEVPAPPPAVAAKIEAVTLTPEEALAQAREAYKEALGKQPYYGWDASTLLEKITTAAETA